MSELIKYNTEIGLFCAEHEDWATLLVEKPFCLKIKEDGPFVMFSYDQIYSDFNNPIVQEARGIIFKKGKWENPVCWAFNKFGNYGESYVPDIDWDTAFVSEKIDGSLIKVWWDWCGGWHVSTNGTIDAFKAEINNVKMANFGDYFCSALFKYYDSFDDFTSNLDMNITYMFELVGPYNRVVVPYEEPDLYFLGARNKHSGEEFGCKAVVAGALGLGKFKLPKIYQLNSLEACIICSETFSWDQEGFVVADASFNRVKVKSPSYVLAHFMRNNNVITRKHLIKVITQNEVEEFLCYAADYTDALFEIKRLMDNFLSVGNQLVSACQKLNSIPRNVYAEFVKVFPKIFQGLMFFNRDRTITAEEYTANWNETKWDEYLTEFEKLTKNV